jgi:hypothetical protein
MISETCKSRNFCSRHSAAETWEANWHNSGLNGYGRGHLISGTLVKGPSRGEERKWGLRRRSGAGAMGDGLSCREHQLREQ